MTDDGRFVTADAVRSRFEGTIPAGRTEWLKLRILDAETELMGLVPSLQSLDPDTTDPVAAIRVGRVRTLIIDKVLELYRNPDGAQSKSQALDGITSTRSYSRDRSAGPGVTFTDAELNRVRLPKPRRPKIGTYGAAPWRVP